MGDFRTLTFVCVCVCVCRGLVSIRKIKWLGSFSLGVCFMHHQNGICITFMIRLNKKTDNIQINTWYFRNCCSALPNTIIRIPMEWQRVLQYIANLFKVSYVLISCFFIKKKQLLKNVEQAFVIKFFAECHVMFLMYYCLLNRFYRYKNITMITVRQCITLWWAH